MKLANELTRFSAFSWLQWPVAIMILDVVILVSPLIPFRALSGTGYHDGQRIITTLYFLVAMLVLIWRLRQYKHRLTPIRKLPITLLTIFWALGLLSSIGAYSPRHALYEWASLGMLFLISWMIAAEVGSNTKKVIDQALLLCGAGCSLYIFHALVAYVSLLIIGQQPDPQDLIVGFDNYRFLNHIQTISLPLLGLLVVRGSQPDAPRYSKPSCWFVIAALWWMLTFVSAGRGTFLGVWTGMLVVMVSHPRQAWPWFRIMSLSCSAGLVAYVLLYLLIPLLSGLQPFGFFLELAQRTMTNPDSSRWPLWQRAIELVAAHPWLGVGPLHFAHNSRDLQIAAHPHNAVLQIAAEWGLPAMCAVFAVVFFGTRELLRAGWAILPTDLRNQALFVAFVATGVAIAVDSLVSGLIVMPSSQLWIALYIGCAWGWTASQTTPGNFVKLTLTPIIRFGMILGIFILIIFTARGLWPEVLDLPSHELKSQALELHPESSHFSPRIWRAGYF